MSVWPAFALICPTLGSVLEFLLRLGLLSKFLLSFDLVADSVSALALWEGSVTVRSPARADEARHCLARRVGDQ